MNTIDLFAGAGGWDLAARQLGLDPLGIELDADACATRDAAGMRTLRGDVAALDPIPCRGLIASPPCQAWSKAGKRLGIEDQPLVFECLTRLARGEDARAELLPRCKDERSLLVVEPLRWALAVEPEWVALEQVPDVLPCWGQIGAALRLRGYAVWTGVLNAANYGVPQTRERAILIASRVRRPVGPPPTTHSDQRRGGCLLGLAPWVSMADALGWNKSDLVGFPQRADTPSNKALGDGEYRDRDFRAASEPSFALTEKGRSWSRWKFVNGNRERAARRAPEEPAPTLHFGNALNDVRWVDERPAPPLVTTRRSDEGLIVGRQLPEGEGRNVGGWGWERPATAVCGDPRIFPPAYRGRADDYEPDGSYHGKRAGENAVRVTIEEASVLQDFPPDYPWQGTKTARFRQIGNAIPPGLALPVLEMASGVARARTAA